MLRTRENIGEMDRKVTFQQKVIASNVSNEDEEAGWIDLVTTWAKVEDSTGDERFQADGLTPYIDSKITIRYRSDISVLNRVIYRNRKYNILAITELDRDRYLELKCATGITYKE